MCWVCSRGVRGGRDELAVLIAGLPSPLRCPCLITQHFVFLHLCCRKRCCCCSTPAAAAPVCAGANIGLTQRLVMQGGAMLPKSVTLGSQGPWAAAASCSPRHMVGVVWLGVSCWSGGIIVQASVMAHDSLTDMTLRCSLTDTQSSASNAIVCGVALLLAVLVSVSVCLINLPWLER